MPEDEEILLVGGPLDGAQDDAPGWSGSVAHSAPGRNGHDSFVPPGFRQP